MRPLNLLLAAMLLAATPLIAQADRDDHRYRGGYGRGWNSYRHYDHRGDWGHNRDWRGRHYDYGYRRPYYHYYNYSPYVLPRVPYYQPYSYGYVYPYYYTYPYSYYYYTPYGW